MFCPECKAELPDDAKYCIRCGYDFARIKTPPPEQKSSILDRLRTSPRPDESEVPSVSGEALNKGEVFARRYRILSDGKRGGMGVVYKCEDQKLNRTVALKIIHPRLLSSEQAVKRFRQEVSISLELLHRNIVRVHNLDEYEGIEFFTMEWVEGKSLREILNERVKEKRPFTLEEAYPIISQLSDALQYAHRYTIHRDIKPENILTYKDEEGLHIKVTDFGIAKMLTPAQFTTTSLQMGTPYYMAPEQKVDAAHVDKRADIYAVGVVLFELLTLENMIGLEMPSEINPDLPREIDQIIKRAIATKPENRYGDVKELSDGLGNVVKTWKQGIEEEKKRAEELRKKEAEELERRKQEEELRKTQKEEKRRLEELIREEEEKKKREAERRRIEKEAREAEELRRQEEAKRKRRNIALWSGLAVIVIALLIIIALLINYFGLRKTETLPVKEGLIVSNLQGYEERVKDISLFVIQGEVRNVSKFSRKHIKARVVIFDNNKARIAEKESICGKIINREDLKKLPTSFFTGDILVEPSSERGRFVSPGKTIPFMFLFKDLPASAQEFKVEIVEAPNTEVTSK